jgi:hypothetical protein
MNDLAERKRELISRSEQYRRAMAVEFVHIKGSVAWIPRTLQVLRWASPLLVIAAPLLGILTGRKISTKPPPEKKRSSMLAKIMGGIAMYRKVRSIVDTVRPFMAAQIAGAKTNGDGRA